MASKAILARSPCRLCLVGALTLALGGCKRDAETAPDHDLLARIGESTLRVADLEAEIERRIAAGRPVPPKSELLAELVRREVLIQCALEAGLDKDPESRRSYENLLIGTYKERTLHSHPKVVAISDAEVRSFYEAHRDRYTKPARRRLAIIHVAAEQGRSPERREQLRQRAVAARDMALNGKEGGFAAAAVKHSDHQASRYRGGEIGWVERERGHAQLSEEVIAAGFTLALGSPRAFSKIIEDESGLTLVKLLDHQSESVVPLDQVAGSIRSALQRDRRSELVQEFEAESRARLPVEIFEDRLDRVEVPQPTAKDLAPRPPEL